MASRRHGPFIRITSWFSSIVVVTVCGPCFFICSAISEICSDIAFSDSGTGRLVHFAFASRVDRRSGPSRSTLQAKNWLSMCMVPSGGRAAGSALSRAHLRRDAAAKHQRQRLVRARDGDPWDRCLLERDGLARRRDLKVREERRRSAVHAAQFQ